MTDLMGLAQDKTLTVRRTCKTHPHQCICEASCKVFKTPHLSPTRFCLPKHDRPLACPLHQKGKKIPTEFACSTRSLINCISASQLARCLAGEILLHRHYSHLACSLSQLSFSSWSLGSLRRVVPTTSATSSRRQLEAWKHRDPLVSARASYWLPLLWFKRVFLEHSSVRGFSSSDARSAG